MFQKTNEKLISQAVEILNQGGIVVFPTDTVFGVGCRLDKPKAIQRLFKARNRPKNQATPVLVDSILMVQNYLLPLKPKVESLMKKYWPGALTIICPCQIKRVTSLVRGGGRTLGVRIPNHQVPLQLIKLTGVPLLGPSANFHGGLTPYQSKELDQDFLKLVDLVIPGECQTGLASTVVDCSKEPWQIIRQGTIII